MRSIPQHWDTRLDTRLIKMKDEQGMTFRQIASTLGYSAGTIARHYHFIKGNRSALLPKGRGISKPPLDPKPVRGKPGIHLEGYNSARRGFHLPAEKEGQYFDLLKNGIPIAEAARRLGLSSHSVS